MPRASHELRIILKREIEANGPMPFARFMELALYHPVHGYYLQPLKQIGCQGDFYTSVSVGALFGQLLGLEFGRWLQRLLDQPRPAPVQLVEAGAHDGRLALDILTGLQQKRPELLQHVEYWIIEPSPERRLLQAEVLRSFGLRVRWCGCWKDFPSDGVRGVIFSNELLDAFPIYRLGWDAARKAWFEWRVVWQADQFRWTRAGPPLLPEIDRELSRPPWTTVPPALLDVLPDGFTIELSPSTRAWWSDASRHLCAGKIVTLDYGFELTDVFAPQRQEGTLRSYRKHHLSPDPLADPGSQDLTAHVNFSVLSFAGEEAGLKTECLISQEAFLTQILVQEGTERCLVGSRTSSQTREFRTLTHPDHFGRAFRVLVQSR